MWELSSRNENKQWTALGNYPCMADAARRILELESDDSAGFFFRIYIDPFTGITGSSDAELFSRLEYQGGKSVLSTEV